MNNTLKIAGGFLLGAAIGTATGILIAPDNGKKTRKMLLSKSDELKNELTNVLNRSMENFRQNYNSKVEGYTKSGHKTLENIKDTVKVKEKTQTVGA